MEILVHKNGKELLDYLPHIKSSLKEWLFVDIRLKDSNDKHFTVTDVANPINPLFKDKDGKIYICNDSEILVLLHWGKSYVLSEIAVSVERQFPEGRCEVRVSEPTPEALVRLEALVKYREPVATPSMADIRSMRRENVILLADDDMFIRILVKNGISAEATLREVEDGNEIMAAYKQYVPDILFLDIHMPNREGDVVLGEILAADPKAYVVMISADGSRGKIYEATMQKGAKSFLTKPFTKAQLMENIRKCPTIS